MSLWRRSLDFRRKRRIELLGAGVTGTWATVHSLEVANRPRAFEFAAQALARYDGLIDKPMMTSDVIWRFACISSVETLKREYAANLVGSKDFENVGDLALWIVPTLIQFCFAAELLRRDMWSKEGRDQAALAARIASDRIGLLARTGKSTTR